MYKSLKSTKTYGSIDFSKEEGTEKSGKKLDAHKNPATLILIQRRKESENNKLKAHKNVITSILVQRGRKEK